MVSYVLTELDGLEVAWAFTDQDLLDHDLGLYYGSRLSETRVRQVSEEDVSDTEYWPKFNSNGGTRTTNQCFNLGAILNLNRI
jgi:hypothetical protein